MNRRDSDMITLDTAAVFSMIEDTADGLMVVDADGVVRFANPAARQLLMGMTEELVGSVFGVPVIEGNKTELDVPGRGSGPGVVELRVSDSTWRGEPAHVVALRDVTDRARTQASRILSHVGEGVFAVDTSGLVVFWNPAAAKITGISPEDVLGRPAVEAIPDWEQIAHLVPMTSEPGTEQRRIDARPLEIDGHEIWLSIGGVSFGEGIVYAFRDVTVEHHVERRERDFIATASHELRTPVASIHGAAETLRRDDIELSDRDRELLMGAIYEQSNRLCRLVDDLLVAGGLDVRRVNAEVESFDLQELVQGVVDEYRAHVQGGMTFSLPTQDPMPQVAGDAHHARQVLTNLLDNAVKYSPDGGEICVALQTEQNRVRVSIHDEGLGIPATELTRIFEKFYRLDPNMTRGVGGTGLGLYICRELMNRMCGRIWAESSYGDGSSFHMELPAADTT